ncbi:MAG: ATP-binding protein [Spirosomataceae bacterium]
MIHKNSSGRLVRAPKGSDTSLSLPGFQEILMEVSQEPLFIIGLDGKIMDMNLASFTLTGLAKEELIGKDFFTYFTEPEKAKMGFQQICSKGFLHDYPLTICNDRLTAILFNGAVYADEKGKGVIVVARNNSGQKRIEKELTEARSSAELATATAEEAQSKAEDAVKAKQQFLSNMSHEIRTPMNAIIGFTKVVLKTDLTVKQREYLTAIKMSGDALIVLINDILDLAKVDAGKMTFEEIPFKMASSISAMLHLFETKIQEKNLVLRIDYDKLIPEVLVGDPVRLHQIILNLVSNAVKFTATGNITVRVFCIEEGAETVDIEFSVTDTGIGIEPLRINHIFDNFQQATSNTARLYGGTGLGLAIVKQLVEQQGGCMQVQSEVDKGSTFSFVLRFKKTQEEAKMVNELIEFDKETKGTKVLVVEDMALNQLLMKTLLDDFGFECDIAANGKIAIEKLNENSFDVILMDLQMPIMNGFETTEYIRNTLHSSIPIMALTADVTTVDLAKCTAVGMNDYIAKPIDERLLYSKIVGLVKNQSKHKVGWNAQQKEKSKCIDLDYLSQRTKSNPKLMFEMISLYLEQTPPLIVSMKQSLQDKDWIMLHAAVHKMIPSFSIMGINGDFEQIAKQIQEYASTQQQTDNINEMVLKLENVCVQACQELEEELLKISILQ